MNKRKLELEDQKSRAEHYKDKISDANNHLKKLVVDVKKLVVDIGTGRSSSAFVPPSKGHKS